MTRKSKRELERELDEIGSTPADDKGFHYFIIGGDPDPDETGYYTWNPDRGAYVNEAGHERPPEDAPDGGFEFNIEYPEDQ